MLVLWDRHRNARSKRMRVSTFSTALFTLALVGAGAVPARAQTYTIDPIHSSVAFKIQHVGLSWIVGRFNEIAGSFTIDKADPGKGSFEMTIQAQSIDTNNTKRDTHLRSPDFFNVKQFPVLTFKSTAVRPTEGGYEVTGDFTMHGVTRPLTVTLKGGKEAEFPKGVRRTGYTAELTIKRSEFGITKFAEALSDDVGVIVSFEGILK
jgi:polyisoprenoid-binding protein YceI